MDNTWLTERQNPEVWLGKTLPSQLVCALFVMIPKRVLKRQHLGSRVGEGRGFRVGACTPLS